MAKAHDDAVALISVCSRIAAICCLTAAPCRGAEVIDALFHIEMTQEFSDFHVHPLPVFQDDVEGVSRDVDYSDISGYSDHLLNLPNLDATVNGTVATAAIGRWRSTYGQLSARGAGEAHVSLGPTHYGYMGFSAQATTTTSLKMTFDEPVKFRIYYDGRGGGVQLLVGEFPYIYDFQGIREFEISGPAELRVVGGATANAFADNIEASPESSSDSAYHSGASFATWAISALDEEPVLPGATPTRPILVPIVAPPPEPGGGFDPIPIGGQPIHAEATKFNYLALREQIDLGTQQGGVVTTYRLASADLPMTSLVVPEPLDGAALTVAFGDQTRNVVAGETIDFGPAGIGEFLISGLDPAGVDSGPEELVLGLGFAGDGFTSINVQAKEFIDPADANLDGNVDAADLSAWQANFGSGAVATHMQGDADGDRDVDGADFLVWQRQFKTAAPIAPVPEPSSLALASCLIASFYRRRLACSV